MEPISPITQSISAGPTAKLCPNGCGHLAPLAVSGIAFERCIICGGIYLAGGSAAKLRTLPSDTALALEREIAAKVHPANPQKAAESRSRTDLRPCPNCRTLMLPYTVRYHVEVTLDHCGVCDGYWADDSELEAVSLPLDARHEVALDARDSSEFRNEVIEALYENEGGAPHAHYTPPPLEALGKIFPTFAVWVRAHHAVGGRSR